MPKRERESGSVSTTVMFSVREHVGALDECLQVFKAEGISLSRIESRPSLSKEFDHDFFVDIEGTLPPKVKTSLSAVAGDVRVLSEGSEEAGEIWFPRKMADLDRFAERVLSAGAELESDHPGFTDPVYRRRRQYFADLALKYRYGEPIPVVEYTDEEKKTWNVVYTQLTALHPTHACEQFRRVFPMLEKYAGYSPNALPQLSDVSRFLSTQTGFTLRPVAGLLSSRDFLAGLAFRVFHSTQYIRHHTRPLYTPEPDVCHELLGHVPLFADPDFADFSQSIGLASLGASDDFVKKLATCYWFTVEFGLCKEAAGVRAYGAGLLSSFGELKYCLTNEPKTAPFDPHVTAVTAYPITTFQPLYFVAESFRDMTRRLAEFASYSDRPFSVYFDANSKRVVVLDTLEKLAKLAQKAQDTVTLLQAALSSGRIVGR